MYEVEYKVEITETEKNTLQNLFMDRGFISSPPIVINDYYVEAEKSLLGGYNIKRYRDQGSKIIYTEKIWESVGGEKVRKETEIEVSREEFNLRLAQHPDSLKIHKERQSYSGNFENQKIHIDIDNVKFDHSKANRYFMEAEILTNDSDNVSVSRSLVVKFLKELLGRGEITESPSMFNLAFNKL